MQNPTLPLELIREILLRLPVRSILRFKCVCKSWLSLISDSQFGISHFDLAAAPTHRLFLIANDYYGESIDTDAPLLMGALRFILPPTSPTWRDEYGDDYLDKHEILGSCRGLMLLYYDRSSDLILWNPSNGAHKLYPRIDFGLTLINLFGFGYDSSTDDYLLILVGLSESKYYESGYENDVSEDDNDAVYAAHYNVFSFKTDSWDMKNDFVSYKELGDRFRTGLLFNEALHWLVFSKDKKVPVIIAFDVIQRSLSEIPLFDYFTMKEYKVCSLRVIGGCLSVFCSVQGCAKGEIWVMKEYKVASSWTKSIVVTTNGFSPICIAKDGGIIGSNICGRLEKLNDKGELLEHFIYGGGQWQCYGNLQFAVYRESLLSIPTVVKKTIEFDLWGISEDDHGEASEDDHREIGEDDLGETSEDEQQ